MGDEPVGMGQTAPRERKTFYLAAKREAAKASE